jgi:uncharacterized protein (TIGR03437 family)
MNSMPRYLICFVIAVNCFAAQPNRIAKSVNPAQVRALHGNLHPLARPQYDQGPVDAALEMDHVMLLFKPSAAQQADLDQLLAAQQNPASADFHKWLTPEAYAERFGLSTSDHSRVVAWLQSQGLTVQESGRGRNWVAFHGNAGQVSRALHTSIHRYAMNGEAHMANATEPSVPEALADITGGFIGLDDFHLKPFITRPRPVGSDPAFTKGTSHYLAPEDFATIYDLAPLYQSGYDGTGQSIAIVGASDVAISDIRAFRSRFNLPANDPKFVPYGPDPGFTGAQIEGDLDLQWAGAIAPKATIYYVYGPDPLVAVIYAVSLNVAPVISISYGNCEIEFPALLFRTISQQGNAQGITLLSASGDSGAAGCDSQGLDPFATRGQSATFPSNLPEVTGVGGTQFSEGNGNYWAAANNANSASVLSYIPEVAWNESAPDFGLGASGGGVSTLIGKPDWQAGTGVPNDNARDIPDVAMSAAVHDGYLVTFQNSLVLVGGTSASSPSLAGIIALLNQYEVKQGFQAKAGLGNINPQLYRLAQSAPAAFHDITSGGNFVPCAQGTPDCVNRAYGYAAGPGYDLATGLGSIDANNLVTQWNTVTKAVVVTLTAGLAVVTLNDTVQLTATVAAADGSGTPTGTVNFLLGSTPLGTAVLSATGTASVTFQASLLGTVRGTVTAGYSGDAQFSGGSGVTRLQISLPAGVSAILASISPSPVYAAPADAQGLSWQTIATLVEAGGVPSTLTAFTINGQAQSLAQYFPSTSIPANGSIRADLVFRNLAYPVTKTFGFTGVDATGATWIRTLPVTFLGPQVFQNFNLSAVPLTMLRNPAADAACQWSQQLTLNETGGFAFSIVALAAGNIDITDRAQSIFGTMRLAPYGSLQGTLCWSGITAPASNNILIALADEFGNTLETEMAVSFASAAASPTKLTVAPAAITLQQSNLVFFPTAAINISLTDKTQAWTASVSPGNRTTAWLSLSQYSGTGPAQIKLTASGAGFEAGVYRALIAFESSNAVPQVVTVPVMFIYGVSAGASISGAANGLSFKPTVSPGQILAVTGSQLSNSTLQPASLPLPFEMDGVAATVNGLAAPLYYTSPGQLNIQVPYEAGSGPGVVGINNHGQIAGFPVQITASAPAIVTDAAGSVYPTSTVAQGQTAVLYMTGDGDVTQGLPTGATPAKGTAAGSLPRPRLPVTVTVGGVQAFLQFIGIVPGTVGVTQVNFTVPASVPPGVQPVRVTVGSVISPAANITVQ